MKTVMDEDVMIFDRITTLVHYMLADKTSK
jgi:hypothetical protein